MFRRDYITSNNAKTGFDGLVHWLARETVLVVPEHMVSVNLPDEFLLTVAHLIYT